MSSYIKDKETPIYYCEICDWTSFSSFHILLIQGRCPQCKSQLYQTLLLNFPRPLRTGKFRMRIQSKDGEKENTTEPSTGGD